MFTPYQEELTLSVAHCVVDAGDELAKTVGMGIRSNRDIGRVTANEIVEFVDAQIEGVDVDCIFLSCTNWQAIDAIAPVTARFGMPVISSNQATIEAVRMRMANVDNLQTASRRAAE